METVTIDAGGRVRCQDCGRPQSGSILRREDGHLLCRGCAGRRLDAEAHVQALYDQERDAAGCGPVG